MRQQQTQSARRPRRCQTRTRNVAPTPLLSSPSLQALSLSLSVIFSPSLHAAPASRAAAVTQAMKQAYFQAIAVARSIPLSPPLTPSHPSSGYPYCDQPTEM